MYGVFLAIVTSSVASALFTKGTHTRLENFDACIEKSFEPVLMTYSISQGVFVAASCCREGGGSSLSSS